MKQEDCPDITVILGYILPFGPCLMYNYYLSSLCYGRQFLFLITCLVYTFKILHTCICLGYAH